MVEKRKRPGISEQVVPKQEALPDVKKAAYRVVRPRPLRYDEKIRILWPGDPAFERYDNGSFATWMRETTSQHDVGLEVPSSCRQGDEGIQVPQYRLLLGDEQPPQAAIQMHGTDLSASDEAAYIRLRGQTQDEIDDKVDYDLDSDDEQWLDNRKAKAAGEALDKDDLERLIDGFEKAKREVMERKQTEWQRAGPERQPTPPDKMHPGILYPVSSAMKDFADNYSSLTVRAVHNYWAKKAAASKLPLLQKFWYDKPWARLVDLTQPRHQESSSDDEEGIPFQGKDSPQTQHHRKKAMDVQDVEDRLNHARIDLEKIRTIADQIRRREKIKKRMMASWREEWQHRLALASQARAKVLKAPGKKGGKVKAASVARQAAEALEDPTEKILADADNSVAAKRGVKKGQRPAKPAHVKQPNAARGSNPMPTRTSLPTIPLTRSGGAAENGQVPKAAAAGAKAVIARPSAGDAAPAAKVVRSAKRKKAASKSNPQTGLVIPSEEPEQDLAPARNAPDGQNPAEPSIRQREELSGFGLGPPAGFDVYLRSTPGKPRGYVEWQATCRHGCFHLDRTSKIVELFREHVKCRPQWKKFARAQKESAEAYTTRLRRAFPFTQSAVRQGGASPPKADLTDLKPRQLIPKQSRGRSLGARGQGTVGPQFQDQKRLKANKAGAASARDEAEDPGGKVRRPVTRGSQRGGAELATLPLPGPGRKLPPPQPEANVKPAINSRATRHRPTLPASLPEQQRDNDAEVFDVEADATTSSSSGSDTFIPPSSDMYSSGEEESLLSPGPRFVRLRSDRLPRQRPLAAMGRSGEWQSGALSENSSLSEGSCPGQFSQEHFSQIQGKSNNAWADSTAKKAKGGPKRRGKNIVAAARQQARQAARRR